MKSEENKKDSVYGESNITGIPTINKKELEKENDYLLKDTTSELEQRKILFDKVIRIEKMVYFIFGEIAVFFLFIFLFCHK